MNKQATKKPYNFTKFSSDSEQREADLYSRVKLGLIAKIRKRVCVHAFVQIQEGESDKKERLSSCVKVVKLSS